MSTKPERIPQKENSDPVVLTDRLIESLVGPADGQRLLFDAKLPGFGIRLTAGAKTFIVQARIKGRNRVCRYSIGKYPILSTKVARDEARVKLGLMRQGIDPNERKKEEAGRTLTLQQAYERYKKEKTLRSKTISVYDGAMRRCFADWLDKPLVSITKDAVSQRHTDISTANGPRGEGKAQANQAMRLLRSVINFVQDSYDKPLFADNPVRRLTQLRKWNPTVRRENVIHDHQMSTWFRAVLSLSSQTVRDYLILVLLTGLRRREAATLTWQENIDFDTKTLKISAGTAKNKREHHLPLSDVLYDLLKRRHAEHGDESPFVFPGEGSTGRLVESKWSVTRVSELSGVKFCVHDCRRTFITTADLLGFSQAAIKKLANHASSDVTDGYKVVLVTRLRQYLQDITDHFVRQSGFTKAQIAGLEALNREDYLTTPTNQRMSRKTSAAPDELASLDKGKVRNTTLSTKDRGK